MRKRFSLIVCVPVGHGKDYLPLVVSALKILLLFKGKKYLSISDPIEVDGDLTTVDRKIDISW